MSLNRASILLVLMILLLLGGGCAKNKRIYKEADKYLQRGDYHRASLLAAESLSLKPSYAKAQQALKVAYPRALQEHQERIMQLKSAENPELWPQILSLYEELHKLNNAVRNLPSIIDSETGERIRFDFSDYSSEIAEAKVNSAEYHYSQGLHFSRMGSDAATQKKAAGSFKSAMQYVPDYKDSSLRYEEARQKAVRRLAILPFEDKSGSRNRYGAITDILADQIIGSIMQNKVKMEFIELITRDQIDKVISEQQLSSSGLIDEASAARIGVLLGAHEILSGRILQIDYNAPRTVTVDLIEKNNITIEAEDGEEDEELEVECYYRKYTKRASVQILASYSVVEVSTGKINTQQSFTASRTFEDEWARFISGDRRALNPQQKALIAKSEPWPPSDKDMINAALSELSQSIVSHFSRYLQ
jgi:hypothetical protein